MVMALDPQGIGVLFIKGHDPGVALRQDVRMLEAEDVFPKEALRRLVATMLAPCLSYGFQLDVGRQAPLFLKIGLDRLQLFQAEV